MNTTLEAQIKNRDLTNKALHLTIRRNTRKYNELDEEIKYQLHNFFNLLITYFIFLQTLKAKKTRILFFLQTLKAKKQGVYFF